MKFTKGPWTLGDENNQSCEVVLGTEHNLTCSFNRQDNNTGAFVIEREEMLANAHLAMAAPAMYEALKDVVSRCRCGGTGRYSYVEDAPEEDMIDCAECSRYRAAISSAEGRTV